MQPEQAFGCSKCRNVYRIVSLCRSTHDTFHGLWHQLTVTVKKSARDEAEIKRASGTTMQLTDFCGSFLSSGQRSSLLSLDVGGNLAQQLDHKGDDTAEHPIPRGEW